MDRGIRIDISSKFLGDVETVRLEAILWEYCIKEPVVYSVNG